MSSCYSFEFLHHRVSWCYLQIHRSHQTMPSVIQKGTFYYVRKQGCLQDPLEATRRWSQRLFQSPGFTSTLHESVIKESTSLRTIGETWRGISRLSDSPWIRPRLPCSQSCLYGEYGSVSVSAIRCIVDVDCLKMFTWFPEFKMFEKHCFVAIFEVKRRTPLFFFVFCFKLDQDL